MSHVHRNKQKMWVFLKYKRLLHLIEQPLPEEPFEKEE
jgi:hypothetical protein